VAATNSTLKWIGIGCGVLVVLGLCIGGIVAVIATTALQATEAPADAARGFFADLRGNDFDSALRRTGAAYQALHDVNTFRASVAQQPALTTQTDVTFTSRRVDNASATMSGNLSTPSGDIPVTVTLTQAGEHWYVESVTVQGQPLR
jgi:hypothetical protein